MKILGIEFNNSGVSNDNITKTIEKIEKSVNIWRGVNLNMMQKVITVRTFILSKLWYIANFVVLDKQYIKHIESLIHKFIWNGAIEMINCI